MVGVLLGGREAKCGQSMPIKVESRLKNCALGQKCTHAYERKDGSWAGQRRATASMPKSTCGLRFCCKACEDQHTGICLVCCKANAQPVQQQCTCNDDLVHLIRKFGPTWDAFELVVEQTCKPVLDLNAFYRHTAEVRAAALAN